MTRILVCSVVDVQKKKEEEQLIATSTFLPGLNLLWELPKMSLVKSNQVHRFSEIIVMLILKYVFNFVNYHILLCAKKIRYHLHQALVC